MISPDDEDLFSEDEKPTPEQWAPIEAFYRRSAQGRMILGLAARDKRSATVYRIGMEQMSDLERLMDSDPTVMKARMIVEGCARGGLETKKARDEMLAGIHDEWRAAAKCFWEGKPSGFLSEAVRSVRRTCAEFQRPAEFTPKPGWPSDKTIERIIKPLQPPKTYLELD